MENKSVKKLSLIKSCSELAFSDPTKAISLIDEFMATYSDDVELLLLKGHIYDAESEFDAAKNMYNKVIMLDPLNVQALIDMGDHYLNITTGYTEALYFYEKALEIFTSSIESEDAQEKFVSACVGKANTLIAMNRTNDALDTIKWGLRKYPDDSLLFSVLERFTTGRREIE